MLILYWKPAAQTKQKRLLNLWGHLHRERKQVIRKTEQSWEVVRVLPKAVGGSALLGIGLRLYSLAPVFRSLLILGALMEIQL